MKLGIVVANYNWPKNHGATLKEIAKTTEESGFDSLWVIDHYFGMEETTDPMLEAFTTLGFIAANTSKVKLGTMVAGTIYREPALLVKAVSTLDVLSNGRAYFGIGAAWYQEEAEGLGFPFPPVKERFERLEETLQITQQMWSENNGSFKGRHYQLDQTINSPQPVTKPHPPILVGGGGEKKTLKLVAKYADACNLFVKGGLPEMDHKLDVLKKHCQNVGRNYEKIEKTAYAGRGVTGSLNSEEMITLCQRISEMGFEHLILALPRFHEISPLEKIGKEVIPAIKDL